MEKINLKVRETKLITTGIYGVVRNPVYSAFLFVFTGALLFEANFLLLLLPIVYWGFLTLLMKKTEEKWLLREFGEEYAVYCREVNRVIPWFPKRKS
ncbi:methyltransferase family protein [Aedoeadaptatus pacaensis]|uniref:methyltransferase family protein n=1 Tax=Aedoeadaptatus pacaensis TaxID=1776390 RepID=UPI000A629480|nr:isoprenylcysteine carboxylmethyltransferase family protein [Peptoniphilus pacaensis]